MQNISHTVLFRRKYVFDMYGEYETAEKRSMAETTTKRRKKEEIKRAENKLIGILQFYFILLRLRLSASAKKQAIRLHQVENLPSPRDS